ncbi:MAG: circularly permuted type 2 ATP-grasp protein [Bacteriovoracia bacterium]
MDKRLFQLLLALWLLAAPFAFAARDVEKLLREEGARAKANAGLYYDEIFDRDGQLRPQYKDIYPRLLEKEPSELKKIRALTKKDFLGDNALSPVALITEKSEHDLKRQGVAQRGRALLEFLKDHYSGKKTYSEVMHPALVDRIIARTGETSYAGHINPESIRFMYGPDIIRDADGVFRVLEDNTNFLGGQGDLVKARESLWKRLPEYATALDKEEIAQPMDFYKSLLTRYRREMPDPKAPVVFFSVPPYPDNEDVRLNKIWKELGVETVTPFTRNPKLVKKKDGLYLERKVGAKVRAEKIGYLILNTEFGGLDPGFAPSHHQFLFEAAKEHLGAKGREAISRKNREALEKALVPDPSGNIDYAEVENVLRKKLGLSHFTEGTERGLVEAIVKGQVLSNNTPGIDFINDKEFNIYVEDLIRHYLKEEPILRNLPARRLYAVNKAGERVVDEKVFRDLERDTGKYVVKVVDGRGGEGVWVGPRLSAEGRAAMLQKLQEDTGREVIVQEYRHPSVLAGDIVDERVLAQVGPREIGGKFVEVSETGWSRGVSMAGDGKVNLSAGKAHEVTVLQRRLDVKTGLPVRPRSCSELYREALY